MKTTKRMLALLLALTLALSGLAPAAAAAGTEDALRPAAAESVTLTVWSNENDQEWLSQQTSAFQAAHPEWDITWEIGVCNTFNVYSRVSADPANAADVYLYSNDYLSSLLEVGALTPLSGDALDQVVADNSHTMVNTLRAPDAKIYGVPMMASTWFLYYNKNVFTEADVTSLDTMLEKGVVTYPVSNTWYLAAFYFANGGTMFGEYGMDASAGIQFGGENGTAATKYVVELLSHPNCSNDLDGFGYDGMRDGTVDAYFCGAWDYNGLYEVLGEDLGAVQAPSITIDGEAKQLSPFVSSIAYGVNPHSDNVDAAMALAAFLGTEESQKARYEANGAIPTIGALADDPVIASNVAAVAQINTLYNAAVVQPVIPEIINYWSAGITMGSELAKGVVTLENAAEKTAEFYAALNPQTETDTTISLWTYPIGDWGNADSVDALIAGFEADNPGVNVEVTYLDYATGTDMLNEAIANGTAPDLVLEGPELLAHSLAEQGLMADLSGLLTDTAAAEIYSNALRAGYGRDGGLYMYPMAGTVHTMAINKTIFEAAGAMEYLDEETHTWNSTEDFCKAVAAVYAYTGQTVGTVYCGGQGGDQGTRALVTNLGGGNYTDPGHNYYTWDSAENIAALEMLYELEGIDFNSIFVGGDDIKMFRDGYQSMTFCWNMNLHVNYEGKTENGDEILFMAFPSDAAPQLQSGVWGLGVLDNGDEARIEAAKTLVQYLCDSDATADAVRTAGCFAVRDSVNGTDLSGIWPADDIRSEYTKLMPMMGDYYMVTPNWSGARSCWFYLLQDVGKDQNIAESAAHWTAMANAHLKTQLHVLVPGYGGDTNTLWENFEADYEAANEHIDLVVEVVSWNDLYTILDARMAEGNAPDILGLDIYTPYLEQLLPVDSYLSEDVRSRIYANFLTESESDGQIWALPNFTTARGLFYNPAIFEEVGIDVPATWAGLMDACAAIDAHYDGSVRGWGIDMTENEPQATFALHAWANNGGFLDEEGNWALNSDANVEAMEFLMSLYQEGYTNDASQSRYAIEELFAEGKIAMMIDNQSFHYLLDGVDAEYAIADLPHNGQGAHSIGIMDRLMCFDNGYSEEELAAVTAFFDLYYDDTVHCSWVQTEGFLPATASAMEQMVRDDASQAAWADILPNAKLYPTYKPEWYQAYQGMKTVMNGALEGENIRTLLNNLQAEVTGIPVEPEVTEIASGWSGYTTWSLTDDGTLTFSGEGAMKNYTYKTEMPWYDYFDQITRVVIEEGVTSIGSYAFYGMPELTAVEIAESVTAIGDYAFKNCAKLDGVVLPGNLTSLGDSAFYACTSLTAIEIPASLWTVKPYTFKNCTALESVTFHEGNLQKISDGAFYGTAVREVTFPDCLDILDVYSFKNCAALETITLGTGLTQIREAVFYGTAIADIVIPEGITKIRPYAFKNCANLRDVTLPESLTAVDEASFYACTALEQLILPDAVTSIGSYAFRRCTAMETILFSDSLVTIGESSFYGCTGLTELMIPDNVTTIGAYAFKGCTGVKSITLGDSVETLGDSVFHTCTGLRTIVFPETVTSIGEYCFSSSYNLWQLTFLGDAPTIGTGAFKGLAATACYPGGNPTWTSANMLNYGGKITWKAV